MSHCKFKTTAPSAQVHKKLLLSSSVYAHACAQTEKLPRNSWSFSFYWSKFTLESHHNQLWVCSEFSWNELRTYYKLTTYVVRAKAKSVHAWSIHQSHRSLVAYHLVTNQPGLYKVSFLKSRPDTEVDSPWRRKHCDESITQDHDQYFSTINL